MVNNQAVLYILRVPKELSINISLLVAFFTNIRYYPNNNPAPEQSNNKRNHNKSLLTFRELYYITNNTSLYISISISVLHLPDRSFPRAAFKLILCAEAANFFVSIFPSKFPFKQAETYLMPERQRHLFNVTRI